MPDGYSTARKKSTCFSHSLRYNPSTGGMNCQAIQQVSAASYHDNLYNPGDVSELADEHDLGSCAERREGSIPSVPISSP